MAAKSDYLENKVLEHVLRNTVYTSPSAVYVGLYTAAPTDAGGGTEVSGNGYARKAATFAAASGGATSNSGEVLFDEATGSWGTITHFGIFDASSAGNLLYWAALSASKDVASGDQLRFPAGDLDVSED